MTKHDKIWLGHEFVTGNMKIFYIQNYAKILFFFLWLSCSSQLLALCYGIMSGQYSICFLFCCWYGRFLMLLHYWLNHFCYFVYSRTLLHTILLPSPPPSISFFLSLSLCLSVSLSLSLSAYCTIYESVHDILQSCTTMLFANWLILLYLQHFPHALFSLILTHMNTFQVLLPYLRYIRYIFSYCYLPMACINEPDTEGLISPNPLTILHPSTATCALIIVCSL